MTTELLCKELSRYTGSPAGVEQRQKGWGAATNMLIRLLGEQAPYLRLSTIPRPRFLRAERKVQLPTPIAADLPTFALVAATELMALLLNRQGKAVGLAADA